jgi:hypothetical protein
VIGLGIVICCCSAFMAVDISSSLKTHSIFWGPMLSMQGLVVASEMFKLDLNLRRNAHQATG